MKKKDWLVLSLMPGIGNSILKSICSSSIENIEDLKTNFLNGKYEIKRLRDKENFKKELDNLQFYEDLCFSIIEQCKEKGIAILSQDMTEYPETLKECNDSPFIIYVKHKGKNSLKSFQTWENNITIVGSRDVPDDVSEWTYEAAKILSKKYYNVISGLALGVDKSAHQGALESRNGMTTAIIPNCDEIVPSSNTKLADSILNADGVIISENYPQKKFDPKQLVQRNRIQSGLSSKFVIISQCSAKSGTIVTVKNALKQNKSILVPKDLTTSKTTIDIISEHTKSFKAITLEDISRQSFLTDDNKQKELFS